MDRYRRVAFLLQRTAKLAVYMMVVDIEGLVVGDMCCLSLGLAWWDCGRFDVMAIREEVEKVAKGRKA